MNKTQVFTVSVPSSVNLERGVNHFLEYLHRNQHRLIDIKYSVSQGPLTEGISRELYSALIIYEKADKNNLQEEKYVKPEK